MKTLHQKIYLVRHGETEWSKSGQHTGTTDLPLTNEGLKQAEELRLLLEGKEFKKVFVSPVQRAQETCKIAGFFKHAEVDEDLREWDYGKYEGLTTPQIRETDPRWNIFIKGAPDGESVGDMGARANRVIAKLKGISGDVALFSSGHFLRSLTVRWLDLPLSAGIHFPLSTASISILGYERENPALILWNRTINL